MKLKEYIRLIRPKHYIKNILLFLPIIFGGSLLQKDRLLHVIGGFVVFSFVSSVVYIINDICDAEKDRHHPTKCTRPIASGKIQKKSAAVLACFLLVASVAINWFVCEKNLYGWLLIALYLVLNRTEKCCASGYSDSCFGIPYSYPLRFRDHRNSGFKLALSYGNGVFILYGSRKASRRNRKQREEYKEGAEIL